MKDFEEIKRLWQKQPAEPVSIEDIFERINEQKSNYASKLLIQTIAVAIALLCIFMIWITAVFITWTSHLAMLIIIAALIYYFKQQVSDYSKINKSAFLFKKPEEYIVYLKGYKRSRLRLNTKAYQLYVVLIAISLILFSIEMYYILELWQLGIYLLLSIGWILVCQFIIMKQYQKREAQRLEKIINNLKRLSQQFF